MRVVDETTLNFLFVFCYNYNEGNYYMSVNLSAYIEKKDKSTGEWKLVTEKPVFSRLKYILDDYNELPRLKPGDVSKELLSRYSYGDEKGVSNEVYGTFYVTTIDELNKKVNHGIEHAFSKINTIVKALGCVPVYDNCGDEIESDDYQNSTELTVPVVSGLVYDLQVACANLRSLGNREMLAVIFDDYTDYGEETRVVLVLS